jgi:hypothetical protein
MAIFRFKVTFEDVEGIYRIIDIKSNQSFEDLHKIILRSINFNEGEFASFYVDYEGDDEGIEICLSDLQSESIDRALLMKDLKIGDIAAKNMVRLSYIYDFTELWIFRLQVENRNLKENPDISYPSVYKSEGKAPEQTESSLLLASGFTKDDTQIIRQLRQRNKDILLKREIDEEYFAEQGLYDEEDLIEEEEDF